MKMAHLVRIGNSQGVRIPKSLIEQAHLEGRELKFQVVEGGLLITPEKTIRQGWKEAIDQTIASHGREPLDEEWLDLPLESDEELDW